MPKHVRVDSDATVGADKAGRVVIDDDYRLRRPQGRDATRRRKEQRFRRQGVGRVVEVGDQVDKGVLFWGE